MNFDFAAKHIPGKWLRVFDFDDTLASTAGAPWVVTESGEERRLSPRAEKTYKLQPGEKYDWREFLTYLKDPVVPVQKNIDILKRIIDSGQGDVIVLTARGDGAAVKKYLRDEHNIDIEVFPIGSGDIAQEKKWVIETLIRENGYTNVQFWDDSASNVRAMNQLKDENPELNIQVYKVPITASRRLEMSDYDNRKANTGMKPTVYIDPMVTIEEHKGAVPVSYMAYSNTVNMMHDIMEIMQMMNNCDDLPQWVDQCLAEAADRVAKAKRYIMSEKSKGGSAVGEPISFPAYVPSGVGAPGTAPTFDVSALACSCGCDACGAGTCHCPPDCACGCRSGEVDYDFMAVATNIRSASLDSKIKEYRDLTGEDLPPKMMEMIEEAKKSNDEDILKAIESMLAQTNFFAEEAKGLHKRYPANMP